MKMKNVGYYLTGLAFLTLALVSLHLKGLYDAAELEKNEIDRQISSAVCNTFEYISTDDSNAIEVQNCANLGNGSFQIIANSNKRQLDNLISQQLRMEDQISFPYQITIENSDGKNNLPQSNLNSENGLLMATVNIEVPPLHNVILTNWGAELMLIIFISSMMVWIYYNIIGVLQKFKSSTNSQKVNIIQIGKYTFDVRNQALSFNNRQRRITEKECQVLKYLCHSKNQISRRDDILMTLWGENDYFKGRSLDVFITRLRKYLSEDETISIETVHGVGFILVDKPHI